VSFRSPSAAAIARDTECLNAKPTIIAMGNAFGRHRISRKQQRFLRIEEVASEVAGSMRQLCDRSLPSCKGSPFGRDSAAVVEIDLAFRIHSVPRYSRLNNANCEKKLTLANFHNPN